MKARLFLSPLDGPVTERHIDAPTRLIDAFPDADIVEWFKDGGCIRLNGHIIPPDRWNVVTVKPHHAAVLDFVYVPAGKKTFALLATVALVALTTAITAGFAAPFLGAGFAAGTFGASALAAGVGIAGTLAISALTAPPKAGNQGEAREQVQAGISGNTLTLLDTLPVVIGKIGTSPAYLAPPYTEWDGDDVYANAAVGVQGRCLVENVKINGIPVDDYSGATYETREGEPGESARTMFTQTVIEERDGITLTNFKTELDSNNNDLLTDQTDPDSASPQWHPLRTAGTWDKVLLRFMFPSGIVHTANGLEAMVPLRVRMRKVGETTWRNLPTFHIHDKDKGSGPMRAEISLERIKQPAGRHFSDAFGEYPIVDVVSRTGYGQSFAFDSDEYFHGPATHPSHSQYMLSDIPLLTNYTTSSYTVSASSEFSTSYRAWYAADAVQTGGGTYWRPAANSLPAWWQIQCPSAKTYRSYTINCSDGAGNVPTYAPTSWMVQGSNDGSVWTDLDSQEMDISYWVLQVGNYQIENPGSYSYYRINFTANNGAASEQLQVAFIGFYETDIPGSTLVGNDIALSTTAGMLASHGTGFDFLRTRYVSLNKKGARVFLDPDQWEAGEYEIQVKRGVAYYYAYHDTYTSTSSGYDYNGSSTNADYFDYRLTSGQYKIYVGQRLYRSDMMIEAFQTISDETPFDDSGIAMIAVSVPNIQISSIYAEFTRYASEWDGSIWSAAEVPTQNPAALYRQILLGGANAKPAPGESIDEDGLADWYETCDANGYEANAILQGARVGEAKQLIATAGYASPRDADTYGVVEDKDTSSDPVRFLITPLNSKDEGTTQELPDLPDAIRAEFSDASQSYAVDHTIVYRDGMDASTARIFETVNYPGFTDAAKVEARAAFDLKQSHLRQVRYTRRMGLEGMNLRRGTLVGLGDDVIDGDRAAGWIKSIELSGGNVVSITLDNIMPFSAATDIELADDITAITDVVNTSLPMGVAIRIPGGEALLKQVDEITDSNVCTFTTPFTYAGSGLDVDLDAVGLMVVAGHWGNVVRRCKVMSVVPQGYEDRIVILADEAPGLFS